MQIAFLVLLFVVGACFGSFLCCEARRLRLKEKKKPSLGRRSVCMSCHYQLKWYDNLPIISWLALGGKCRKCHKKIGSAEILSEISLAVSFLLLGLEFDLTNITFFSVAIFSLTLLFTMIIGFLAIYDGLYGELPSFALALSISVAIITLVVKCLDFCLETGFSWALIYQPILAALLLGGVYLLLHLASKGRWVGDGDWLLGTAIAIMLANFWLALIALFLANFIACLIMYPAAKSRKNHQIYFGPFLAVAFVITQSFANYFLSML